MFSASEASEKERLDAISRDSLYSAGANAKTVEYSYEVFSRFMRDGPILELGPAEGVMTQRLVRRGQPLTVVEGATAFCADLRNRHPEITVVNSLFEVFQTKERFANIILGHVLEHVEEPVKILRRVSQFLAPNGRILAAVPNARSLHRQAAVIMGLLKHEHELNEADLHHGHRRVYNPESLRKDFLDAGLRIELSGGYWLKPLANSQIEATWSDGMLNAFMRLGERYPDIAGEIWVAACRPE